MFSIEDINEMQKTIERKDRIIKVLKERVRQWIKEYNILDEIIEMYKMSENEANEIIAELKEENERLKEANQSLSMLGTDLASANETVRKEFLRADKNKDMWREKAEKLQQTLQEIKKYSTEMREIANDDVAYHYFGTVLSIITKSEEE